MGWVVALFIALGVIYWIIGAAAVAVFFAVGAPAFWLVFAIAVVGAWYLVSAEEDGALAVLPIAAFLAFTHFIARFNLVEWVRLNIQLILQNMAWYLLAAFCYSMFRFLLHLRTKAREIDNLEKAFRREYPFEGSLALADDGVRFRFGEVLHSSYHPYIKPGRSFDPSSDGVVPTFDRNKYTIFRWFWWWPLSLLGWIFNDLIRTIWDVIKQGLRGVIDWMSSAVFGDRAKYTLTGAQYTEMWRRRQEEASRQPDDSGYRRGPGKKVS